VSPHWISGNTYTLVTETTCKTRCHIFANTLQITCFAELYAKFSTPVRVWNCIWNSPAITIRLQGGDHLEEVGVTRRDGELKRSRLRRGSANWWNNDEEPSLILSRHQEPPVALPPPTASTDHRSTGYAGHRLLSVWNVIEFFPAEKILYFFGPFGTNKRYSLEFWRIPIGKNSCDAVWNNKNVNYRISEFLWKGFLWEFWRKTSMRSYVMFSSLSKFSCCFCLVGIHDTWLLNFRIFPVHMFWILVFQTGP
jgi:hypothetical protein